MTVRIPPSYVDQIDELPPPRDSIEERDNEPFGTASEDRSRIFRQLRTPAPPDLLIDCGRLSRAGLRQMQRHHETVAGEASRALEVPMVDFYCLVTDGVVLARLDGDDVVLSLERPGSAC
jgi:hypothetical protein